MALLTDLRGKIKDYWRDKYDQRTGDGTTVIWKLSKAPLTSQALTLYTGSASTACTENNQYSIDKDTGIITFLSGAPAANSTFEVTYQYATFSDDQLYRFLNNGIKALSKDLFNDTRTDLQGTNNLYHLDHCDATANWNVDNYAITQSLNSSDKKEGEYCFDLGMTTTANSWTYDNVNHSLLEDPGFETTMWTMSAGSSVAGSSTVSRTTAAAASAVVGWCINVANMQTGAWVAVSSEYIRVKPNTDYVGNAWIRTDTQTNAHWKIMYYSAATANTTSTVIGEVNGTSAWAAKTATFTTPATTEFIAVQVLGGKATAIGTTGQTWFDEVTVKPAETNSIYYRTFTPKVDISKYDYLNGWVYVADTDQLDDRKAVEVRIGNDSANYYQYQWGHDQLNEDAWTHINAAFSDMTAIGSVSESATDYLEIRFNSDPTSAEAIASGGMRMDDWRLSTFPIESTNQLEYRLPKRWRDVNRLEAWDENGYVGKIISFETFGDKLRIDETAGDGTLYKMYGTQDYDTLYSSGSYATDMPRDYDEMVINHAAAEALESLLVDRTRYTAYSTNVTPQGASVGSLQNASILYRKLFEDDIRRHGNMAHATEIAPTLNS